MGHNCGAASGLPAAPALANGGGGTFLAVDGACFLSCPCGNLVFMHNLQCAFFGEAGVPAAPVDQEEPAPVAESSADTVTTAQAYAAGPVDDGSALSLARDGLCVVYSRVRPRNDVGGDDAVFIVNEHIDFREM